MPKPKTTVATAEVTYVGTFAYEKEGKKRWLYTQSKEGKMYGQTMIGMVGLPKKEFPKAPPSLEVVVKFTREIVSEKKEKK